ncbi:MAG: DUF975 family protein [Dehalococcoidia bacterium]|nr:DUF975 family protein [Dehalococcoidia bacterium]
MQTCPNCGTLFETDAKFCAKCGQPAPAATAGRYEATGGKLANKEIMLQAKEALSGHWGLAIGTVVVAFLLYELPLMLINLFIPFSGTVIGFIIGGPAWLGISIFFLALCRKQNAQLEQIFQGFKRFKVALCAYLLLSLFVLLWMLLLIIPGIIAALSYSQTFFILAEDEAIGARDALRKSKQMMEGNRWKFFCLNCRFIGWGILCILTLGIGFLWLMPYMSVSFARFYDDVAVKQAVPPPQPV